MSLKLSFLQSGSFVCFTHFAGISGAAGGTKLLFGNPGIQFNLQMNSYI